MRVLKANEVDRTVRLVEETEGKRELCKWVDCGLCHYENCVVNEYIEEAKKQFTEGLTYDEAVQFIEDK